MEFIADKAAMMTITFKILSAYGTPNSRITVMNGLVAPSAVNTFQGTNITIKVSDNK